MRTRHSKRLLSLFMALLMVFGLLPITAWAVANPEQIKYAGEEFRYDENGTVTNQGNAVVKISNAIEKTDTENVFDVTLEVKTKQDIKEISVSEDAAVVLVLDISTSMADKIGGQRKIDLAVNSAQNFLENYSASAKNKDGSVSKRYVSLVVFAGNAEAIDFSGSYWLDVAGSDNGNLTITKQKLDLYRNSNNLKSYTNLDAGLMVARNLFRTDNAGAFKSLQNVNNCNVVLLTDGEPNATAADDYIDYKITNIITGYESNSSTPRKWAKDSADKIKSNSFQIDGNNYSKNPATLYTIGFNTSDNIKNWLRDHIASANCAYTASTGANLELVFDCISYQMNCSAEAWTVTAPMGAYMVWDNSNVLQNGAYYNSDTRTLEWDLKKAQPTASDPNPNQGWRTYQYKYKIKLDTSQAGFEAGEDHAYNINGTTELNYVVKVGDRITNSCTVPFSIPQVCGFAGTLDFTKVNPKSEPLGAGYRFELEDQADANKIKIKDSNSDGLVQFNNIPSGQSYLMSETGLPAGTEYKLSDKTYIVQVSYGQVSIFENDNGKPGKACTADFKFVNPYDIKGADISITKNVGSSQAPDETFTFGVFKEEPNSNSKPAEQVAIKVENDDVSKEGTLSLTPDVVTDILNNEVSATVWVAEMVNGSPANADTKIVVGSGDQMGRWTFANAQSVTINRSGVVDKSLTFSNTYEKYTPVYIQYYLNGTAVDAPVIQDGYPVGTTKDFSGSITPSMKFDDQTGYFLKAAIGNGEPEGDLSKAKALFEDIEITATERMTLNIYYRTVQSLPITVSKTIGKLDYDKGDVGTAPSSYVFTFKLYEDAKDEKEVAIATLTFDTSPKANKTQSTTFEFVKDWKDSIGKTLYIKEEAGPGWSSNATQNCVEYCTITDNAIVNYVNSTAISNAYHQALAEEVTFTIDKYFAVNKKDVEIFLDNLGYDKAQLVCSNSSPAEDVDSLAAEGEDEADAAEVATHEHDASCYEYTFEFELYKGNGKKPIETVPLTLTAEEILDLAEKNESVPITFTLTTSKAMKKLQGNYFVREKESKYVGWNGARAVDFSINKFGRVTTAAEFLQMQNTYQETLPPSFTIIKNLMDERDPDDLYSAGGTYQFTIKDGTGTDVIEPVTLTLDNGSQQETVVLNQYLGEDATLTIQEVEGEQQYNDGQLSYDNSVYTVEITDGVVTKVLKGGEEIQSTQLLFTNSFKQDLYPSFTITKLINQTVDEENGDSFTFAWEAYQGQASEDSQKASLTFASEDTIAPTESDTLEIIVTSGDKSKSSELITLTPENGRNFTGYILVWEVLDQKAQALASDNQKSGWVYDTKVMKLTYVDGALTEVSQRTEQEGSFTTVDNGSSSLQFVNNYYQPDITAGISSSTDKIIADYQPAPFDIVIGTGSSTEDLKNLVLRSEAFKSEKLEGLQLKLGDDTVLEETNYTVDKENGSITLNDVVLPMGEILTVSYKLTVGESYIEGGYTNTVTVNALGKDSNWEVEATATVTKQVIKAWDQPQVSQKVAVYDETTGKAGDYQDSLTGLPSGTTVIYEIWLKATGSAYGPEKAHYSFDDLFNGVSVAEEIAAQYPEILTWNSDTNSYELTLTIGGDGVKLYYVKRLNNYSDAGASFTNTATLQGAKTEALVAVSSKSAGLSVQQLVADYTGSATSNDQHSYDTSGEPSTANLYGRGKKAIFQVTIQNRENQTLFIDSINANRGAEITEFMNTSKESLSKDALLASLSDGLQAEQSFTFYFVSDVFTSKGSFDSSVEINWHDQEGYQGSSKDSALVTVGWSSGGGGNNNEVIELPDEEVPLGAFTDVHYAYIVGYEDKTVKPENYLSRAEAATVFFRLLQDEVRMQNWTQENGYKDIAKDHWYNNAVSVMNKMQILSGYPSGEFNPNGSITRAELATIAAKFARMNGNAVVRDVEFNDIGSHWAEGDILYASNVGFVDGYVDGSFRPNGKITRAEFMAIVNRMLGRAPETVQDLIQNQMASWTDNKDTSKWYYLDVQEATNSHNHSYKDKQIPNRSGHYEYWTELLPNRDWTQLEQQWSKVNASAALSDGTVK